MKTAILRNFVVTLRKLKTTSFTAEEDLTFIKLMMEVDNAMVKLNDTTTLMLKKYNIALDDQGEPISGDVEKFKGVYDALLEDKTEFANRVTFATIRKLKNENSLDMGAFKLLHDYFMKEDKVETPPVENKE